MYNKLPPPRASYGARCFFARDQTLTVLVMLRVLFCPFFSRNLQKNKIRGSQDGLASHILFRRIRFPGNMNAPCQLALQCNIWWRPLTRQSPQTGLRSHPPKLTYIPLYPKAEPCFLTKAFKAPRTQATLKILYLEQTLFVSSLYPPSTSTYTYSHHQYQRAATNIQCCQQQHEPEALSPRRKQPNLSKLPSTLPLPRPSAFACARQPPTTANAHRSAPFQQLGPLGCETSSRPRIRRSSRRRQPLGRTRDTQWRRCWPSRLRIANRAVSATGLPGRRCALRDTAWTKLRACRESNRSTR